MSNELESDIAMVMNLESFGIDKSDNVVLYVSSPYSV